jgi:hypothetical protein
LSGERTKGLGQTKSANHKRARLRFPTSIITVLDSLSSLIAHPGVLL